MTVKSPIKKYGINVCVRQLNNIYMQLTLTKNYPPHIKEVSNVWAFGKDGKSWFNQKNHPDLMRK